MALTIWVTFALVLWLVLWSIGGGAFDVFLLALLIIVVGATLEILKRYLPNRNA
jgi:hypothetical protein